MCIFNSSLFFLFSLNNQINIFAKNYIYILSGLSRGVRLHHESWSNTWFNHWQLVAQERAHGIAAGWSSSFTSPCLQLGALPACFFSLGLVLETTVGFFCPKLLLFLSSCSGSYLLGYLLLTIHVDLGGCACVCVCTDTVTHTHISQWGLEVKYLGLIQELFGSSGIWGYYYSLFIFNILLVPFLSIQVINFYCRKFGEHKTYEE